MSRPQETIVASSKANHRRAWHALQSIGQALSSAARIILPALAVAILFVAAVSFILSLPVFALFLVGATLFSIPTRYYVAIGFVIAATAVAMFLWRYSQVEMRHQTLRFRDRLLWSVAALLLSELTGFDITELPGMPRDAATDGRLPKEATTGLFAIVAYYFALGYAYNLFSDILNLGRRRTESVSLVSLRSPLAVVVGAVKLVYDIGIPTVAVVFVLVSYRNAVSVAGECLEKTVRGRLQSEAAHLTNTYYEGTETKKQIDRSSGWVADQLSRVGQDIDAVTKEIAQEARQQFKESTPAETNPPR
ncbi:MAG: hypothetical protein ACKVZJ_09765 [Phycisphaerales bacterium]